MNVHERLLRTETVTLETTIPRIGFCPLKDGPGIQNIKVDIRPLHSIVFKGYEEGEEVES